MKLNQVWNIFRKDVRHQWLEILVSLVLVFGFARAEMAEWSRTFNGAIAFGVGGMVYGILGGLAVPLLPLSWMFLIVRAVHAESLAGDRQFWVTRPYDWKQLLAAKILFVVAFVNVPFFLAHVFLVYKAGFHPAHYLAGLLWLQLFWMLILLLPTAALAAVTRNIGHMLLALLFVGVFTTGYSMIGATVPNSSFSDSAGFLDIPLIIIAAIAVIVVQYSLRRTVQSRWLIAGLAVALILILVATPYRRLIARAYPPAGNSFPLQLSLNKAPTEIHYTQRNQVPITIQFLISGLPQNSFVELNGYMLTLRNSSGQHWDSHWQGHGEMFFPEDWILTPGVAISKDQLDQLSSSPITGDLLLAFTVYHDSNPRPFVVPRDEFFFPDLGFCSGQNPLNTISSLSCRTALRRPPFLMVASEMAASTCPLPKDQLPPKPGDIARAFIRGGSTPAEPGLSPILMDGVTLSQKNTNRISGICPGTPLTLSYPEEAGRSRVEVHIDSSWFDAYLKALNRPIPQ